jgi:hypothetical protein
VEAATPLAALRELAAGPAPESGLAPVLPAGLVVDAVSVESGAATVRVSGPAPESAVVASAMGRTLSGQFRVTALRLEYAGGPSVGPVAVSDSFSGGRVTYLWRGLPVPVAATLPDGPDRPAAALRRLLAGPAAPGVDELPAGVRLLSVQVKGDLARVSLGLSPDLTTELVAGRWQFAPHAMAVVYTLTDLPGIRRVQFDFPNLPPEARRNCKTPLGVPLVRPDAEAGRVHT